MKITENIYAIKHHFQIATSENSLLDRFVFSFILSGEYITLIDSGVKASVDSIFKYIEELGRDKCEVDSLILSHAHPDHIGGADSIKQLTHCKIMAHEEDRLWIEDIETQYSDRPVPGFFSLVDKSNNIDIFIEDEDLILTGAGVEIKALHTPGHSPGSLSLHFTKEQVLFTADLLPVPGDIPIYNNYCQLRKSIVRIKQIKDINILLSSMKEPVYGYDNIKNNIEKTDAYLDKIDYIVKKVYSDSNENDISRCKIVIKELELPEVYANNLSHQAFLSHLNN